MRIGINGFIWLDEVVEKIDAKHGVSTEEVEEVFMDVPLVSKIRRGRFRGEDVYRALGHTRDGRHLTVFFILKRNHQALVISARDMDGKERRSYARKKKPAP